LPEKKVVMEKREKKDWGQCFKSRVLRDSPGSTRWLLYACSNIEPQLSPRQSRSALMIKNTDEIWLETTLRKKQRSSYSSWHYIEEEWILAASGSNHPARYVRCSHRAFFFLQ
jgi:hypothetical protein